MSHGPISVSELAKPLSVTLAAVVQHLQILEESSLVQSKKKGRVRTYEIIPASFSAAERWINECRSLWERRLDRLGNVLDEES